MYQQPQRQLHPHRSLKLRRPTTDTENLRENKKSQENQEVSENRDSQVVQKSLISAAVPGALSVLVPGHVAKMANGIKIIKIIKENHGNQKNHESHGYHDVRGTQGKHAEKTQENQDVHASVEEVALDGAKAVDKSSQEVLLTPLNCENQENQKNLESHVNSHVNQEVLLVAGSPSALKRIKIFYLRAARVARPDGVFSMDSLSVTQIEDAAVFLSGKIINDETIHEFASILDRAFTASGH